MTQAPGAPSYAPSYPQTYQAPSYQQGYPPYSGYAPYQGSCFGGRC